MVSFKLERHLTDLGLEGLVVAPATVQLRTILEVPSIVFSEGLHGLSPGEHLACNFQARPSPRRPAPGLGEVKGLPTNICGL
eukprot:4228138-Alexandrium_andersonii.AAC.1